MVWITTSTNAIADSGGSVNQSVKSGLRARALFAALLLIVILAALVFGARLTKGPVAEAPSTSGLGKPGARVVRVLAYSSFLSTWGPGPTLKRMFEHEREVAKPGERVSIEYLQAEDAGLLLAKLKVFPSDLVIGFDQFTRTQAESDRGWTPHGMSSGLKFSDETFFAFDWAPIGFVFRAGEIDPPKSLDDLLSPRFKGLIALQDPRSSSPGYQFLAWVVAEKGETGAREYLQKLKPNVQSVSGSWSQSYGLFTRGLAKLVLSYATSPLYHRYTEKDERYRFAPFATAHPAQVEYAVIPDDCKECELAKEFARFLISPPAQQVLMNKNWMLPINALAAEGTAFGEIIEAIGDGPAHSLKIRDPIKPDVAVGRDVVLKLWEDVKF